MADKNFEKMQKFFQSAVDCDDCDILDGSKNARSMPHKIACQRMPQPQNVPEQKKNDGVPKISPNLKLDFVGIESEPELQQFSKLFNSLKHKY